MNKKKKEVWLTDVSLCQQTSVVTHPMYVMAMSSVTTQSKGVWCTVNIQGDFEVLLKLQKLL